MGITRATKDAVLSVKLYPKDFDEFRTCATGEGLSSAELLVKLLNEYKTKQQNNSPDDKITLTMSQRLNNNRSLTMKPLKKITFRGKRCVYPESFNQIPLESNLIQKIADDFGICVNEDYYNFFHVLNLYINYDNGKYLVQERIYVRIKDGCYGLVDENTPEEPLRIDRCKFVNDYQDVVSNFSRYAHPYNLEQISYVLAEDIGTDYTQMEEYF